MFTQKKSITFKQLQLNIKIGVFRVNYNNTLMSKDMIDSLCILTNSKVVLWDYVNMTATLKPKYHDKN